MAVSVFVARQRLITNVYIDGFNLYYRALKDTPFRWLDLSRMAETLLPGDDIHRVCYFTARLRARPANPAQPQRQQAYLRALATLPGVEIHYGSFRSGVKRRPLAEPVPGLPAHVLIRDSEEKGSDVNLATRLLVDGFRGSTSRPSSSPTTPTSLAPCATCATVSVCARPWSTPTR